jgi:hypothetical protein
LRRLRLRGISLVAATTVVAALMPGIARADPIAPAALLPALNLYIDALTAGHAAAQVCADAKSPARDEAEWAKAKAVLVATLWASGFPTDFTNQATTRLSASAPAAKLDCGSDAVFAGFGDADHEGWLKDVGHGISGMDLTPVSQPVGDTQWQAIRNAIAREMPLQKRALECLATTMPGLILVAVHDWDEMLLKIGGKLVTAGLPRDQVAATLRAAEANSLWKRADPDGAAALAVSCAADNTWSDRFFQLGFMNLGGEVDKLLPPPLPDSDNN